MDLILLALVDGHGVYALVCLVCGAAERDSPAWRALVFPRSGCSRVSPVEDDAGAAGGSVFATVGADQHIIWVYYHHHLILADQNVDPAAARTVAFQTLTEPSDGIPRLELRTAIAASPVEFVSHVQRLDVRVEFFGQLQLGHHRVHAASSSFPGRQR